MLSRAIAFSSSTSSLKPDCAGVVSARSANTAASACFRLVRERTGLIAGLAEHAAAFTAAWALRPSGKPISTCLSAILAHAILVGERRLDGFVGLPGTGDIRKIAALARLTRHAGTFRQGVNSGFIQTLAAGTGALAKGRIDS